MDQSAYVLIEVSPDGSTKIHEVFEAESLALAKEYASARNETELDWYVQRFRVEGPVPLGRLTRMEDGRLVAFPRDPQTQPAPSAPEGWLRAIDEALVVAHIGVANPGDTYEQATDMLGSLIGFHVDAATDPKVNGGWQLVPVNPTETFYQCFSAYDGTSYSNPFGLDEFVKDWREALAKATEAKP